ncbi:Pheromone receptor 1 [Cyphellophora attinorum]|uniref:Pheromone receptor 1 n=1 Tax=Cyphellophora attinorum TaxID=1664694 RepID=A0A0N0NJP3_9EURO|nr:Pheromone receptor 1 [Phialophora attinorum]KPI36889.1 Pheromone receptor 1 [Phialophora attinorum]
MVNRAILEPAIPTCAILALLLAIPPLINQIRAKNFATIIFVASLALLDIRHAVNAFAFYGTRSDTWDAPALCQVDIRARFALYVAIHGANACIFRQLSSAMRTDRIGAAKTRCEKITLWAFDIALCVALPVINIAILQLAISSQYTIIPVIGCLARLPVAWKTVLVTTVVLSIDIVISAVFLGIIIWRLFRHRLQVDSLVLTSSASKRRFTRLCFLAVAGFLADMTSIGLRLSSFTDQPFVPFALPEGMVDLPGQTARWSLEGQQYEIVRVIVDIVMSYLAYWILGLDKQVTDVWRWCVAFQIGLREHTSGRDEHHAEQGRVQRGVTTIVN